MFGFYGFEKGHYEGATYYMPYHNGEIVYPCPTDKAQWGHAILAVGYDDKKKLTLATSQSHPEPVEGDFGGSRTRKPARNHHVHSAYAAGCSAKRVAQC